MPGTPVRAIGDGLVVFAGVVAGNRAVTLLHPDGLRSSYSYLADVRVAVGTRVAIGQVVGTAGERLHLGVRSGGTYLDPAALFTATGVHLVPVGDHPSRAARFDGVPGATVRRPEPVVVDLADGRWGRERRRYTRPSVVSPTAEHHVRPCQSRGRLRAQAHGSRQTVGEE